MKLLTLRISSDPLRLDEGVPRLVPVHYDLLKENDEGGAELEQRMHEALLLRPGDLVRPRFHEYGYHDNLCHRGIVLSVCGGNLLLLWSDGLE
jgi:hypothetical protein